jgi:YD repeat-containing protein
MHNRKLFIHRAVNSLNLFVLVFVLMGLGEASFAETSLWKYNTYNSFGWETPESGYGFASGLSALEELGERHWNGQHGDSNFYFHELFEAGCDASHAKCSARPRYERCYISTGMSPGTRGKWRYNAFGGGDWKLPESGYVYGSGIAALNALGSAFWSGRHGDSTYYFVGLHEPDCDSARCFSRYTFQRCYGDTSPKTKGKWKYNIYSYPWSWTTEESGYNYGDPRSALEALGKKHFSGVHGNVSYEFIRFENFTCRSSCFAEPKYQACDLDTGHCGTHTSIFSMRVSSGDCAIVTPNDSMSAFVGSCDIATPLSYMLASSKPSEYYLSGEEGFDNCGNKACGKECSDSGGGQPKAGNPISVGGGNKYQLEVDFLGGGTNPLMIKRHYNSFPSQSAAFDQTWAHGYSGKLVPQYEDMHKVRISTSTESAFYTSPQAACTQGFQDIAKHMPDIPTGERHAAFESGACTIYVNNKRYGSLPVYNNTGGAKLNLFSNEFKLIAWTVWRPDGSAYRFHKNDSDQWVADSPSIPGKLVQLSGGGYEYTDAKGRVERYSSSGALTAIRYLDGTSVSLSYDEYDRLIKVTDQADRALVFGYDADGRIAKITQPDQGELQYHYDSENRLIRVTYPSGDSRQYVYDDPNHPVGLSGLIDENNNRYATWAYDKRFRAILSEHAGGTDRVSLDYQDEKIVHVTGPLGSNKTYRFDRVNGALKMTSVEGGPCQSCGGNLQKMTYDDKGFVASRTDSNGQTTTYTRDSAGREVSRTEAAGTPQARTISTEWHAHFRKPVRITEPKRVIEYTYDTAGRLLSKSERTLP